MSSKTNVKSNILSANELQSTVALPKHPVSVFNQPHRVMTSFVSGKLIPINSYEVYPGDIFDIDIKALIKQVSPVFPTMGVAKISVYGFFVPNRIIWDDFKYFMGESKTKWLGDENYVIPHVRGGAKAPEFKYDENDLASYLGLPLGVELFESGNSYCRLEFNAYCQIWNDWFRDENLQDEIWFSKVSEDINIDNVTVQQSLFSYKSNCQYGKELAPVSKFPDLFTTCLPSPQRGENVNILKSFGKAPVVYGEEGDIANLMTDFSQTGTVFSINDFRFSTALQHFRELSARGGNRYIELVLAQYGVKSLDLRAQRAYYLGGMTRSLVMTQVLQMTETTTVSPAVSQGLGAFGGMSNTLIKMENNERIILPAQEHGYLMIVACVRTEQLYSQGIDKKWLKRDFTDIWFPVYNYIGEQPLYTSELFYDKTKKNGTQIFGYNEAWAHLRYQLSKMTGYFSANSSESFLSFTYGNNFANTPALNEDFIIQDKENVNQTLRVKDKHQYYGEFLINLKLTRCLPVQSIPGLVRI